MVLPVGLTWPPPSLAFEVLIGVGWWCEGRSCPLIKKPRENDPNQMIRPHLEIQGYSSDLRGISFHSIENVDLESHVFGRRRTKRTDSLDVGRYFCYTNCSTTEFVGRKSWSNHTRETERRGQPNISVNVCRCTWGSHIYSQRVGSLLRAV